MKSRGTIKHQQKESGAKVARETHWPIELDSLLRRRQVGKGFALLDDTEPLWANLELQHRSSSDFLLLLAQWVDIGYRDAPFLRRMLDHLS